MRKLLIIFMLIALPLLLINPTKASHQINNEIHFTLSRTSINDSGNSGYVYQSNLDLFEKLDSLLGTHFEKYVQTNTGHIPVNKRIQVELTKYDPGADEVYDATIHIYQDKFTNTRTYFIGIEYDDENLQPTNMSIYSDNVDKVYSNDYYTSFRYSGDYKLKIGLTMDGEIPIERAVDSTNTYNPDWWVLAEDGYYYLKSAIQRNHVDVFGRYHDFKLIVPEGATLEYDTWQGAAPEHSPVRWGKSESLIWHMSGEHGALIGSYNPNEATTVYIGQYPIYFGAYRYSYNEYDDNQLYTKLEDLPETGDFFNNIQDVGTVRFETIDNDFVVVKIFYDDTTYWYKLQLAPNQDKSMFNESYEAFYYTDNGEKFIVFNHGTTSMFKNYYFQNDTFIPYTIWNLNTNEFRSILNFDIYIYLKEESANNYYAYFYVDEFIIDRLISATVSMQYRYVPLIGTKGEWQPYFKTLEDTNITTGNISWEVKAAAISTALTVGGAFIPGIGLPVLLVGTPISFYLQYQMWDQLLNDGGFVSGSINEIEKVTPSDSLKAEVSSAYKNVYTNFEGINLDQLYKLHLGKFDKPLQKDVEINMDFSAYDNQKGFNIMQFRYMTDGMIYTIEGENLDINPNPGDMGPSDPDIIIPGIKLPDGLPENLPFYILIAVLVLTFVGSILSGMLFRRRGLRNLIFIFVFEIGIYLLYVFGIFDIFMRL